MSDDKTFVDGLIVKRHPNAPDFVKASLSFKMEEFTAFARQHHKDKWLNVQIKESKGGKLYAELDTWEPNQTGAGAGTPGAAQPSPAAPNTGDIDEDSIPF